MAISVLNKHPYSNSNLKQAQWTALTKKSHLISLDLPANQAQGQLLAIILKPFITWYIKARKGISGCNSMKAETNHV